MSHVHCPNCQAQVAVPDDPIGPDFTEAARSLSQQLEIISDILDEIREEVQWAIRNDRVIRVDRLTVAPEAWVARLKQPKATKPIPESITCYECDAQADSLQAALIDGWTELAADQQGRSWNFLGECPKCQARHDEECYRLNPHLRPQAPNGGNQKSLFTDEA